MDHFGDAQDFIDYVSASPSPRHAVAESTARLMATGFVEADPSDHVELGYVARAGSLLAWRRGGGSGPVRVITAHTDSPNLRIKPQPDVRNAGLHQLGVEVYGGALVNTWLDRDLGLAGHVVVNTQAGIEQRLVTIDRPVLRIPQLAIHLDREISTKGLNLNPQNHLRPMWGLAGEDDERTFVDLLAAELDIAADTILAHQMMTYDLVPPALGGWDNEFLAAPRIDNQLSCWASLRALDEAAEQQASGTQIVALFDHEEVGSQSSTGADSNLLADALVEIVGRHAGQGSLCISADGSHATHPNYADRHDPEHQIALNGGPAIKVNANERYATTPIGHALFADACERAGVPHQVYVHRTDLRCGSTVGPVTAARTGLDTVDIGAPQLAMHSSRETTGSQDPHLLRRALASALTG